MVGADMSGERHSVEQTILMLVLMVLFLSFMADAALADVIFSENWESGSVDTNLWTVLDGSTSGWYITTTEKPIDSFHTIARNTDGESVLSNGISTEGYSNITFTFWWSTDSNNFDWFDYYRVDWYDGNGWHNLFSHSFWKQNAYIQVSYDLPPDADNNTDFAVRFRCKVNQPNEGCNVDNITISGAPYSTVDTCAPPVGGDWTVDCSDACIWDSYIEIPGNLILNGTGVVTLNTTMNFTGSDQYIFQYPGCEFRLGIGGTLVG